MADGFRWIYCPVCKSKKLFKIRRDERLKTEIRSFCKRCGEVIVRPEA